MSLEDFKLFMNKLGCAPENVPDEETLNSIFKSRQREFFHNLIQRLQPQNNVRTIRDNILIRRMKIVKDQDILLAKPYKTTIFPKRAQFWQQITLLEKEKEALETLLQKDRREYESLNGFVKRKNIQRIILDRDSEILQDKIVLMGIKLELMIKNIETEEQNKELIITNMPVKLDTNNVKENIVIEAVKTAIFELKKFYNLWKDNTAEQTLRAAKEELWQNMRCIFANIPNLLIYKTILQSNELLLQNVITLKKCQMGYQRNILTDESMKERMCLFKLHLLKTKTDLLGQASSYICAHREQTELEESFTNKYTTFVDDLQKQIKLTPTSTNDINEEIISNFIVQYNLCNFFKSKNDYLRQQIELYKLELKQNTKQLENHQVMLQSIQNLYSKINASINRIQCEMVQLSQIKDKLLYSKNLIIRMLDNLRRKPIEMPLSISKILSSSTKTKAAGDSFAFCSNVSLLSCESFDLNSENVLCSTKIDLDTSVLMRSIGGADTTLTAENTNPNAGYYRNNLSPHTAELEVFAEISLDDLRHISNQCAFFVDRNPLITRQKQLTSTIQLVPGILLTACGALREVEAKLKYATSMHFKDLKVDLPPIIFNKTGVEEQKERISQLVDKITVVDGITEHILQKSKKLNNFILNNSLGQYIPPTKTYNNQTFADYKAEFDIYYRIVAEAASTK